MQVLLGFTLEAAADGRPTSVFLSFRGCLKLEVEDGAADLNVGFLARLNFERLLDHLQRSKFRIVVLKDEFVNDCAVEDFSMLLTDALVIDDKVAFFTAA